MYGQVNVQVQLILRHVRYMYNGLENNVSLRNKLLMRMVYVHVHVPVY